MAKKAPGQRPSDSTDTDRADQTGGDPSEAALDETIESTFPASDPISTIPDPEVPDKAPRRKARRNSTS